MNSNALTFLDLERLSVLGVVLLDQTTRGAAIPWAVTWTPDGHTVVVSHAGAHSVSLVNAPVDTNPNNFFSLAIGAYASDGQRPPQSPTHPVRVQRRIELPGLGPRALAVSRSQLYVANYFSDDLCRIDLTYPNVEAESLALGVVREPSIIRKGEILFNDARLCFQGWQSCASCHDTDARTDGLNWDLLNDGAGNPKNTRSLLQSHQRGRVMALGVRTNASSAVRAGIHHVLFSNQPEEVPEAIDAWLKSLQPIPSPRLVGGQLSPAARRGKELFESSRTGCADCHPSPLFTDFHGYDVGTAAPYRGVWDTQPGQDPSDQFITPTLIEVWRTAPYLHDGSAISLEDVLTGRNPNDDHGRTSHLTPEEIEDLVEYLLSL
jgi:hypothetical protein